MKKIKSTLAAIGLVLIGFAAFMIWGGPAERAQNMPVVDTRMHGAEAAAPAKPAEEIIVPKLTSKAAMGQIAFDENCASCHGQNAAGTEKGPPLVHKIYEPAHHADFAFVRAVPGRRSVPSLAVWQHAACRWCHRKSIDVDHSVCARNAAGERN